MTDCDIYVDEQLNYAYTSNDNKYADELWFINDVDSGLIK